MELNTSKQVSRIGIVEDEIIIAASLYSVLKKMDFEPLEPAYSFEEGLKLLESKKPDLFLIDINLSSDKNGIDLAKVIREKHKCPILFITAYVDPDTIKQTFEVQADGFIVKPVSREQLFASLQTAINNFSNKKSIATIEDQSITVKDGYKYVHVVLKDILYVEADRNYVTYIIEDGKRLMERNTLREVEQKLSEFGFIKINRSHVLNMNKIDSVSSTLVFIGKKSFKVVKQVRDQIITYLNSIDS